MREILFRGKRKDNGEWVEGFYQPVNNQPDKAFIGWYETKEQVIPTIRGVIAKTIGQYTGLTDKKGNKIFEGDICRVTRHCILCLGSITFKNGSFYFDEFNTDSVLELSRLSINQFEIEIIGNIHDNPEMLGAVSNG